MKRFFAAVIGLGNVGQGYDYDDHDGTRVQTHANGFFRHERFDLVAGVDPELGERRRFEEKFRRPAYADTEAMLAHHRPDVVAIAVPTPLHLPALTACLTGSPRAVICEKPIADSTVDARRMLSLATSARCTVLVNYMRRFDPGVAALRAAISAGRLGRIYKGTVWYGKGLRHNGSHFVDLLRYLLGEARLLAILDVGQHRPEGDVEPDFCMGFGESRVYFLAVREENFSLAAVELVGSGGKVLYADSGNRIELQFAVPHPELADYRTLSRHAEILPSGLMRYQWHVLQALYDNLVSGIPLSSDGESATQTLAAVEKVMEAL